MRQRFAYIPIEESIRTKIKETKGIDTYSEFLGKMMLIFNDVDKVERQKMNDS